MARRQGGKLDPPAIEERIGTDESASASLCDKRREGCLDLADVLA